MRNKLLSLASAALLLISGSAAGQPHNAPAWYGKPAAHDSATFASGSGRSTTIADANAKAWNQALAALAHTLGESQADFGTHDDTVRTLATKSRATLAGVREEKKMIRMDDDGMYTVFVLLSHRSQRD